MPAVHTRRTAGLRRTPRQGIPEPGEGGYNYPRGPFGRTGFPGSAPASKQVKRQDAQGRKDNQYRNKPTLTTEDIWARDTGEAALDVTPTRVPKPQPERSDWRFRPGRQTGPSQFIAPSGLPDNPPARRKHLTTGPEHRMTPVIGGIGQEQPKYVRNDFAQRVWAIPGQVHRYRPAPNPGKLGDQAIGRSQYHPDVPVYGSPDGDPGSLIPGQDRNPGSPPFVYVPSRYVSHEGSQEGYAMNREMLFAKGGTPAPIPRGAAPHIRGGRYSGQRYFGPISDQQEIGLDSDAYGISRRRGPRHRPVRFQMPEPWTKNYYDLAPDEGTESKDMIYRSPKPQPHKRPGTRASRGAAAEVKDRAPAQRAVTRKRTSRG